MRTIAILFRAALVVVAVACAQNSRAAASWVDTNLVASPTLIWRFPGSTSPAIEGYISTVAPMPDGKIYVGGGFTNIQGKTRWGLARLHPNGAVDDSFVPTFFVNKTNLSMRLFVEPAGTLLVQGTYFNAYTTNFFVRISATDEVTIVPNLGVYTPLVVQTNGKIVALAGPSFQMNQGSFNGRIVRLNADLSADPEFRESTVFLGSSSILTASQQPDGKAVLWTSSGGGFSQQGNGDASFAVGLTRVTEDGTLDRSLSRYPGLYQGGLVLPDGKLLGRSRIGPYQSIPGFVLTSDAGFRFPDFGRGFTPLFGSSNPLLLVLGVDGFIYEQQDYGAFSRITPEGTLDTDFVTPSSSVGPVVALPDGSVLVGCSYAGANGYSASSILRLRQPNAPTNAVVEFVTTTNFFTESTRSYPIIVKRTGDTNIAVTVTISQVGGTASGANFQFASTIIFQPGEITNAISASFPYDGVPGNNRTALLSVTTSTQGAEVGVRSNQFISIFDRELGFGVPSGTNLTVVEGYPLTLRNLLKPAGLISYFVRVSGFIDPLAGDVTQTFPSTNIQGSLSSSSEFIFAGNLDTRTVEGPRRIGMYLSFTNSSYETDLRLLTTNLSVFVDIQDDDSPAGAGVGLTNLSVRAVALTNGGFAAVANSKEVSLLGRDLLQNAFVVATGSQSISTIAALPNGSLLLGGTFSNLFGATNRNLVRLMPGLTVDTAFLLGHGPDATVSKVFPYPDGRALVSGSFTNVSGRGLPKVVRLLPDGSPDLSLNVSNLFSMTPESGWLLQDNSILVRLSNGSLRRIAANDTVDVNFNGASEFSLFDARLTHDGKIVVAQSFGSINSVIVTNLMRLTATGLRDTTFNVGTGPDSTVYGVAPLADGRCLVGGTFTSFNGAACRYLALLNSDGSLNKEIPVDRPNNTSILTIEPLADGSILIAGSFDSVLGVPRRNVARITADGILLPQTPALLSEPIAAGQRVHLRTEPGMSFRLQSSPDLVNWTTTTSFTATAYTTAVTNPPAPPGEARFLRAIANP